MVWSYFGPTATATIVFITFSVCPPEHDALRLVYTFPLPYPTSLSPLQSILLDDTAQNRPDLVLTICHQSGEAQMTLLCSLSQGDRITLCLLQCMRALISQSG